MSGVRITVQAVSLNLHGVFLYLKLDKSVTGSHSTKCMYTDNYCLVGHVQKYSLTFASGNKLIPSEQLDVYVILLFLEIRQNKI